MSSSESFKLNLMEIMVLGVSKKSEDEFPALENMSPAILRKKYNSKTGFIYDGY